MPFCSCCGTEFFENEQFCTFCGKEYIPKERKTISTISPVSSVGIQDNIVQRSQIGQASIGSISVAPSMTQKVHGVPTCPNCGNILTETNILEYCKICDKQLCKKCPNKYISPVEKKVYRFEYKYVHQYNWKEKVSKGYGESAYYITETRNDSFENSTYVEILKHPLCDECYDLQFINALIALKPKVREIIEKTHNEIIKLDSTKYNIIKANSSLLGVDRHYEVQIIEELEGCKICKGSGKDQTCLGSGQCQTCNGTGKCVNCNGTGKCLNCHGSNICPKCLGKGKGLFLKCSQCGGNGYCNCSNGKDTMCKGTGFCIECHGNRNCKTCMGSGNCYGCTGTGNMIGPLPNDDFGQIVIKVRKMSNYNKSNIYISLNKGQIEFPIFR